LIATLEHLDPLSLRRPDLFEPGAETMENYLIISWKNNLARSNRSLEAMGWTVRPKPDDPSAWDGGMREFLDWAADPAIRRPHSWATDSYNAARKEKGG